MRVKKLISLVLFLSLLANAIVPGMAETTMELPGFTGLSDPNLLRYVEDSVYADLVAQLDSADYFVENVEAVYISKEYLEELAYNSQANIYFGYTLAELEEQFQGTKYVFTLSENGSTIVKAFESYDDTYSQILQNVAIGSGVILLCVTVSVVSGGLGAPAVSMIFAASAKTATVFALSGGVFSGVSAGVVTGMQTGDFEQSLKAAELAASEGFKWGSITGAIAGGAGEAIGLYGAASNGLTMNEAAIIQKETGYPLDVIKQFHSMSEYNVYKEAGLTTQLVDGKLALIQEIDLEYINPLEPEKGTNLARMKAGLSPLDPTTGKAYELHHIGQKADGTLAILKTEQHRSNSGVLNTSWADSEIDRKAFDKIRSAFWRSFAESIGG